MEVSRCTTIDIDTRHTYTRAFQIVGYLPCIYCSAFSDLKTIRVLTLESVFGKFTSIHGDDNGSHVSRETMMICSRNAVTT